MSEVERPSILEIYEKIGPSRVLTEDDFSVYWGAYTHNLHAFRELREAVQAQPDEESKAAVRSELRAMLPKHNLCGPSNVEANREIAEKLGSLRAHIAANYPNGVSTRQI